MLGKQTVERESVHTGRAHKSRKQKQKGKTFAQVTHAIRDARLAVPAALLL